jgi:DNA-binding CsgD family transcriptional regulator
MDMIIEERVVGSDIPGFNRRRLRPREREIADLLLAHYRVPAVAERLAISPHTVRNHLKNIYRRWGIGSQQELLLALKAEGLEPAVPAAERDDPDAE